MARPGVTRKSPASRMQISQRMAGNSSICAQDISNRDWQMYSAGSAVNRWEAKVTGSRIVSVCGGRREGCQELCVSAKGTVTEWLRREHGSHHWHKTAWVMAESTMEHLILNTGVFDLCSVYRMLILFYFIWNRLESIVQKTNKRQGHPCFSISLPHPVSVSPGCGLKGQQELSASVAHHRPPLDISCGQIRQVGCVSCLRSHLGTAQDHTSPPQVPTVSKQRLHPGRKPR